MIARRKMLELLASATAAGITTLGWPHWLRAGDPPAARRPNFLFIVGDNHNARTMGNAGHPFIQTPGMDRLAREGVAFRRAYNTTSLCSPSRASILTGAYAHHHGVKNNHTPWTGELPTFLEHLSGAGYATAFIGKWHMPGHGLPSMPFLDRFVSYTHREGQGSYYDCPMIVDGQEVPSRKPYITEEVTDYAIEFMEAHQEDPEHPFCVYLAHRPGHPPFRAPQEIAGMYDEAELDLPPETDPHWYGKTNGNVFQGVMMGSYHQQYRRYCETLTAMDRDIVRLLAAVDEMGLAENTVVIYLGDNGMQWGTHARHGIREPYEESALLPLIIRAPGVVQDPGSERHQLACNIDLAPTLFDLAGLRLPTGVDGESLVPLLKDPSARVRDAFLMEFWRYFPENTPSYVGVVTERHKYVRFERGRSPWLFDLTRDASEDHNIYDTPAGQALLPSLEARLHELGGGAEPNRR